MKWYGDVAIIGIDSGYGNIKTANCCFPAGVAEYSNEPVFTDNLLVWDGKYYLIGEGHKAFLADKTDDDDYYVLALAAIARELKIQGITSAKVRIAAGLPLTWLSGQKNEFVEYLTRFNHVSFTFRGKDYAIDITGADVFPQGFAAVANRLNDFKGTNMLCDIGNGTMNVMYIINKKPVSDSMFTEKFGTHQCVLAVKENVMQTFHVPIRESTITEVLRFGKADIKPKILETICLAAEEYVENIFRILRDHDYTPDMMRLYVIGGGGCLIRNFGKFDPSRVEIIDDICATAKGYEYMSDRIARKKGGLS